ncbi:hypothetical protein D6827_03460 [Candidatus Parcubacteria bacterium]|nr:MAG: hypothetical protein D6827_03460 [Candidatus Parcubacteria bacterium]
MGEHAMTNYTSNPFIHITDALKRSVHEAEARAIEIALKTNEPARVAFRVWGYPWQVEARINRYSKVPIILEYRNECTADIHACFIVKLRDRLDSPLDFVHRLGRAHEAMIKVAEMEDISRRNKQLMEEQQ